MSKNRTELEKTVDIDDDELVDFDRILSVNERKFLCFFNAVDDSFLFLVSGEHVIDELFEGDIVLPKVK